MTTDAKSGEVWQDAEGTLMCSAGSGKWWVFAVARPIPEDTPTIVQPLTRVFDQAGRHVGGDLNYPNRSAFIDGRPV